MMGLTARQEKCLEFIRARVAVTGVGPSYEEIMADQGLRSKSGVHRIIVGLAQRGCIRRIPGAARAIELIDIGSTKAVLLDADTFAVAKLYAGSKQISVDSAVNAIIRERLGVAA